MSHPLDKDGDFLAKWIENNDHKSLDTNDENFNTLNDVKSIVEHVDTFKAPEIDKSKLFEKINSEIGSQSVSTHKRSFLFYLIPLLLLIFIGFFIYNNTNQETQIKTPNGKHLQHKLPDNSDVILNANAHMAYNNDFKENRTLSLTGEAFFNVEKGSTFKVESPLGTVEVLGTSFNVIAQNDAYKVSCKTGKVKVTIKDSEFILTPGMEVLYYDGLVKENLVSKTTINQWENGISSFEKSPLSMVVRSLEDWYDIDVEIDSSLNAEEYTGNFVQDDLEKALKMVFLPMGLKYTLKDKKLVLIQD